METVTADIRDKLQTEVSIYLATILSKYKTSVIGMIFLNSVSISQRYILVTQSDSVTQHILRHESGISYVSEQG